MTVDGGAGAGAGGGGSPPANHEAKDDVATPNQVDNEAEALAAAQAAAKERARLSLEARARDQALRERLLAAEGKADLSAGTRRAEDSPGGDDDVGLASRELQHIVQGADASHPAVQRDAHHGRQPLGVDTRRDDTHGGGGKHQEPGEERLRTPIAQRQREPSWGPDGGGGGDDGGAAAPVAGSDAARRRMGSRRSSFRRRGVDGDAMQYDAGPAMGLDASPPPRTRPTRRDDKGGHGAVGGDGRAGAAGGDGRAGAGPVSDVPQPRPRPSGSDLPRRTTAAPTATAPTFHQASGSTNIFAPKIAAAVADTSGKSAEVVVCADAIELLKLLDYEQHFLEPRYCFCPPHLRLVFLYTRFSHACMCWWCLVVLGGQGYDAVVSVLFCVWLRSQRSIGWPRAQQLPTVPRLHGACNVADQRDSAIVLYAR